MEPARHGATRSTAPALLCALGLLGLDACARTVASSEDAGVDVRTDASDASPDAAADAPPAQPPLRALSLGAVHSCALSTEGSVWCWGGNFQGMVGDGTTVQRASPTRVAGLEGVVQLANGSEHVCAVLRDGSARCWGKNDDGQLGDGTTTDRATPTLVPDLGNLGSIGTGANATCALTRDGEVFCWGNNQRGQLGDGTTTDRALPARVPGLRGVRQLSVGVLHACAVLDDGTVRCWGYDQFAQLGTGEPAPEACGNPALACRTAPTEVPELRDVRSVAAGDHVSCAVLGDGTARCWGYNDLGDTGTGLDEAERCRDATNGGTLVGCRRRPTPVLGLAGVTQIALNGRNCALRADGSLWCWGTSANALLATGVGDNGRACVTDGRGPARCVPTPSQVLSVGPVELMAVGPLHTCVRTVAGELSCWGDNRRGALGDGTTMDRFAPARVAAFP